MGENVGTKAIVFGDLFFLGEKLSSFLIENGCQVIFLGDITCFPPDFVRNFAGRDGFFFEEEKIESPKFFQKIVEDYQRVQYVFHLNDFLLRKNRKNFSEEKIKNFIQELEELLKISSHYRSRFLLCSSAFLASSSTNEKNLEELLSQRNFSSLGSEEKAQRWAESLVASYFKEEELNARIVRLGEVFGPGEIFDQRGESLKVLKKIISGKKIKIPGDGKQSVFPLFIDDALSGLVRAMFAPNTSGKIYTLLGQETTLLEFAQKAREKGVLKPEIEFVPPKTADSFLKRGESPASWQSKVPLEKALEETLTWHFEERKDLSEQETKIEKKKSQVKKTKELKKPDFHFKKIFLGLLSLFLAVFLPFAFLGINLWLSYYHLDKAFVFAKKSDFKKLRSHTEKASISLSRSKQTLTFFSPLIKKAGLEEGAFQLSNYIFLGQTLAEAGSEGGLLVQKLNNLFQGVFLGEENNLRRSLSQVRLSLQAFNTKVALCQTLLSSSTDQEPFLKQKLLLLKEKLPLAKEVGEKTLKVLDFAPEILGVSDRRTYLVLFQNNMEIRPTGGFIGSFGLFTFENGKLLDFEVQDVYAADGQLRGHVKPPAKLEEFLGLSGWYLRDSNWDPNFPTSAIRAEWFLEKEIGRSVSGVVAVDLFALQKILNAVGEVELVDYKMKVNADNFFERAEYQIEAGFFPGSTEKKDFLGSVARALFEKIKVAPPQVVARVISAIYSSFTEKDILVFLNNEEANKTISQLGWDGSIREVVCQREEECFADFLMLVDANVGVNKANFFVKRRLNHEIKINKEGQVFKKLVIEYENNSPNDIFPAGRYKNYLRVFVPQETVLEEVKIKGGREEEKPKVDQEEAYGKKVFGFLVQVPVREKREVEISYRFLRDKTFLQGEYIFYLQKQPGAFADPVSLTFLLPENLHLVQSAPSLLTNGKFLRYNGNLSKDTVFQVNFKGS